MGTDQGANRIRSMCREPRPGAGSQEVWEDSCSLHLASAGAPWGQPSDSVPACSTGRKRPGEAWVHARLGEGGM